MFAHARRQRRFSMSERNAIMVASVACIISFPAMRRSSPAEIGAERRRDETDLPDKGAAVHGPELEQIERHEICVRRIIDAVISCHESLSLRPAKRPSCRMLWSRALNASQKPTVSLAGSPAETIGCAPVIAGNASRPLARGSGVHEIQTQARWTYRSHRARSRLILRAPMLRCGGARSPARPRSVPSISGAREQLPPSSGASRRPPSLEKSWPFLQEATGHPRPPDQVASSGRHWVPAEANTRGNDGPSNPCEEEDPNEGARGRRRPLGRR
jgi:hypothetical protein